MLEQKNKGGAIDYEKSGSLIKEVRIARNLTQGQLSKDISVTPQAVSLWRRENAFQILHH